MSECTSDVGHFDGHADALKRCTWHRPMQLIQCHTRCPWKPPSGDYLVCITQVATRARGKQTTMKKCTGIAGRFDGYGSARACYLAQLRRSSRALLEATGHRHRVSFAPILAVRHTNAGYLRCLSSSTLHKWAQVDI